MTPVEAIVVAAGASMICALWVRRHTVGSSIERPLTLAVVLCIVGIALISPQATHVVGNAGHALTGMWHLDTYAGDVCLLLAQAAALSRLLASVFTDDDRTRWLRCWIQPVIAIAVPHMAACILLTDALHHGPPNILDATPDRWLTAYWLIVCAAQSYIWIAGLRVLRVLRRDHRSRRIANAYIASASCGVTACGMQITWVLTGWQPLGHGIITWLLFCSACAATCLTAAWSWRIKEQQLRGRQPRGLMSKLGLA